jgi:hypothetical protein
MRRALAILKYVPAVLSGLLVVAWVVSSFATCYAQICVEGKYSTARYYFALNPGNSLLGRYDCPVSFPSEWEFGAKWSPDTGENLLGQFQLYRFSDDELCRYDSNIALPILMVLSAILPLAILLAVRFRFPLWSYFAWTALIAAELAYYLRA